MPEPPDADSTQSADQPRSPDALKNAVRRGTRTVAWMQLASQIVSLAGLAILYRVLSDNPPREFGLVAMVVPVVMFLRIFAHFGLDIAIVQRRDLADDQLSSVFWLNLLMGGGAALATALLAPAVARFYGEPQLYELTLALAGTAILAALGAPHLALSQRRLHLGRVAVIRLAAQGGAAVAAVVAAFSGWGVWALILQQYVELALLAVAAWFAEPWRPARPTLRGALGGSLRFSGYHTASSVVFYLADNLDKVLVGRLVGAPALGLYSQAFNLAFKPVALVCTPLTGVMLAGLSRAADQPSTRQTLLVAFYRLAAIVLLPASFGLAVVGGDALQFLGGDRWAGGGPLLQTLALALFGRALIHLAGPIFSASGRTDRLFLGAVAVLVLLTQGYLAGWWFGARHDAAALGVAWGYTLTVGLALAAPYTIYCLRATRFETRARRAQGDEHTQAETFADAAPVVRPVLRAMAPPLLAALVMGVTVFALRAALLQFPTLPLAARLAIEIAAGAAVYTLLARRQIRWAAGQFVRRTEH